MLRKSWALRLLPGILKLLIISVDNGLGEHYIFLLKMTGGLRRLNQFKAELKVNYFPKYWLAYFLLAIISKVNHRYAIFCSIDLLEVR